MSLENGKDNIMVVPHDYANLSMLCRPNIFLGTCLAVHNAVYKMNIVFCLLFKEKPKPVCSAAASDAEERKPGRAIYNSARCGKLTSSAVIHGRA